MSLSFKGKTIAGNFTVVKSDKLFHAIRSWDGTTEKYTIQESDLDFGNNGSNMILFDAANTTSTPKLVWGNGAYSKTITTFDIKSLTSNTITAGTVIWLLYINSIPNQVRIQYPIYGGEINAKADKLTDFISPLTLNNPGVTVSDLEAAMVGILKGTGLVVPTMWTLEQVQAANIKVGTLFYVSSTSGHPSTTFPMNVQRYTGTGFTATTYTPKDFELWVNKNDTTNNDWYWLLDEWNLNDFTVDLTPYRTAADQDLVNAKLQRDLETLIDEKQANIIPGEYITYEEGILDVDTSKISYSELLNLPKLNGITITGNKLASDFAIRQLPILAKTFVFATNYETQQVLKTDLMSDLTIESGMRFIDAHGNTGIIVGENDSEYWDAVLFTSAPADWNQTDNTQPSYILNKPDLTNFVDLISDQSIIGKKTFTSGIYFDSTFKMAMRGTSGTAAKQLFIGGSGYQTHIGTGNYNFVVDSYEGSSSSPRCIYGGREGIAGTYFDLGKNTYPFKDLFISGKILSGDSTIVTANYSQLTIPRKSGTIALLEDIPTLPGQVTSETDGLMIAADKLYFDTIANQFAEISNQIQGIKNLGLFIGSFDTFATIPKNKSYYDAINKPISTNDFITVRKDETHGGATTGYILTNIAADGTLTWEFDVIYSSGGSGGGMELQPLATMNNIGVFDINGQIVDSNIKINDLPKLSAGTYGSEQTFTGMNAFNKELYFRSYDNNKLVACVLARTVGEQKLTIGGIGDGTTTKVVIAPRATSSGQYYTFDSDCFYPTSNLHLGKNTSPFNNLYLSGKINDLTLPQKSGTLATLDDIGSGGGGSGGKQLYNHNVEMRSNSQFIALTLITDSATKLTPTTLHPLLMTQGDNVYRTVATGIQSNGTTVVWAVSTRSANTFDIYYNNNTSASDNITNWTVYDSVRAL